MQQIHITAEIFSAYAHLRRMRASEEYLKKLIEKQVSYQASLAFSTKQLRGLAPTAQTEEKLQRSVAKLRRKLSDCANEITFVQSNLASNVIIDDTTILHELESIISIPQIISVFATGLHSLRVNLAARVEIEGRTFDLGDWRTNLKPRPIKEFADDFYEYRTGVIPGVDAFAPAYRLTRGQFCFGDNVDAINEYYDTGNFIASIQLAVYALCSINPEDLDRLDSTFRIAQDWKSQCLSIDGTKTFTLSVPVASERTWSSPFLSSTHR